MFGLDPQAGVAFLVSKVKAEFQVLLVVGW